MVDEAYSFCNENLVDNQDSLGKIENDQTAEPVYENDRVNEESQENINSTLPSFMPTLLSDDEISEIIMNLKVKQRGVFEVVQEWARNYVKYKGINVQPIHIFYLVVVEQENQI